MWRGTTPWGRKGVWLALLSMLTFAGALVFAACGTGGTGPSSAPPSTPTSMESAGVRGDGTGITLEVPELVISTYQGEGEFGGTEVKLSEIVGRGKPVVLNFSAALCPPCRAEMPDFQRVYENRGDEVTIVGVDIGPQQRLGTRQQGRELLAELGVKYLAGTTFDESVVRNFQVVGMPTTVFLYSDGRLLRSWSGLLNEAKVNEFIDQLLSG